MNWYVNILDSEGRVIERVICRSNKERFLKTKEFRSRLGEGERVCVTRHEILSKEERIRLWAELVEMDKLGTEKKKKYLENQVKKYDLKSIEEYILMIV